MTPTPDAQKIVLLEAQLEAMEIRARELESALDDAQLLADERSDEIAALKAELAQYDLGEWEDDRLKEWLPNDAEQELIARLESRAENWRDEAAGALAEVARLRGDLADAEERAEKNWERQNLPCGDALDKLWKDILLARNPNYGDWEYPAQAYRHIRDEFNDQEKVVAALRAQLAAGEPRWIPISNLPPADWDGELFITCDLRHTIRGKLPKRTAVYDAEGSADYEGNRFHFRDNHDGIYIQLTHYAYIPRTWPAPPQE